MGEIKESEPFKWSEFLILGDKLFNYMINNYNIMINNNKIRYFEIMDYRDKIDMYDKKILDVLNDNCLKTIEDKLIPWIETQHKSGQLFEKSNWKPFRDQEDFLTCVLGYKILFQYDKYYFQLVIDYCYVSLQDRTMSGYFQLSLIGWKEDDKENLQPDDKVIIPHDNIMPDWYWDEK
jgi:hypothetical protein